MVIELPDEVEQSLKFQANARGLSVDGYLREVIEREVQPSLPTEHPRKPLKSGFGSLKHLGPAPSSEDIAEMRQEVWKNFGEHF